MNVNQKHLAIQKEMINDIKVLLLIIEENIDPAKGLTKMARRVKVGNCVHDARKVMSRMIKSISLTACVECGTVMDAHDNLPPPHNKIRECPRCGHPNDPGIRE